MFRSVRCVIVLLLALFLLLLPQLVAAQEEAVPDAPGEQQPVVVQVESDGNQGGILIGAVLMLVGGLAGGGSVYAVFARLNANKPFKDSTEKYFYDSVSRENLHLISQIAGWGKQAFEFVEDVTDGKDNLPGLEVPIPPGVDPAAAQAAATAAVLALANQSAAS